MKNQKSDSLLALFEAKNPTNVLKTIPKVNGGGGGCGFSYKYVKSGTSGNSASKGDLTCDWVD